MIYEALIKQGYGDIVNSCFGLDVQESVRCRHCDLETHMLRYTQYFQVCSCGAPRTGASNNMHRCCSSRRWGLACKGVMIQISLAVL